MSGDAAQGLRRLAADNRRMLGKLLVVALLMFGFGYALVPIYKAMCDALGINVLSLSELQTGAGPAAFERPGRPEPHRHHRVRRQRPRAVGLQAGAGLDRRCTRASWRP